MGFKALVILSIFAGAFAQAETISLKLTREDSMEFVRALTGLTGAKRTRDEFNPALEYEKLWFSGAGEALQLGCVRMFDGGEEVNVECRVIIKPEQSNPEVVVLDQGDVVYVTIEDDIIATRLHANLDTGNFSTRERVSPSAQPRLKLLCVPDPYRPQNAKNCRMEVRRGERLTQIGG